MVDALDLVELQCLSDPHLTVDEMLLFGSDITDRLGEFLEVGRHIIHASKVFHLNFHHDFHVFSDKLRSDCLPETLDNDLRLDDIVGA